MNSLSDYLNIADPIEYDDIVDDILSSPVRSLLVDRLRYQLNNPGRSLLYSLMSIDSNGDFDVLIRQLHQQDVDISYLSHQLRHFDGLVKKFDNLTVTCAKLRNKNARLIARNNELLKQLSDMKSRPTKKVKPRIHVGNFGK